MANETDTLTVELLDEWEDHYRNNCLRIIRLQDPCGRLDWQYANKDLGALLAAAREGVAAREGAGTASPTQTLEGK